MSQTFCGKSWEKWIEEYGWSHQHPVNRLCHSAGGGDVRGRMVSAVRRPCIRTKIAGVLPGLEIPVRRTSLVGQ
jgi:hypothetical protein